MATINYATQAAANVQAKGVGFAHDQKVAYGAYTISDSGPMAPNAAIYMCKIPKGAVVFGGRVYGDPIDSSGSGSALACIHVGLTSGFTAADGTVYGTSTNTACLVSSLPLGPDCVAITGFKNTNQRNWPFGGLVISNGPLVTTDDGYAVITFTASALALTTGTMRLEVDYYAAQVS